MRVQLMLGVRPGDTITLRWFRDQGRGQEAADAMPGVLQVMDHAWPVAVLPCPTVEFEAEAWERLYNEYGVNAVGEVRVNIQAQGPAVN